MERLLQPTVLLPLSVVAICIGIVAINAVRRVRERQLQYHQDLRIREMEHQRKMKELEVELEKAKRTTSNGQAA